VGAYLLPLSADDPGALRAMAEKYADLLGRHKDPWDVCFSAGARRTHHHRRLAVAGADRAELTDGLRAFASGQGQNSVAGDEIAAADPPRVVFVFPGEAPRLAGVGRDLFTANTVFTRRMRECARAVEGELGWSPLDRLDATFPPGTAAEIRPTLWAIQVSLAAVWRDCGLDPDLIIGRGSGDAAAAVVAGTLTVEQGAAVVCRENEAEDHVLNGARGMIRLGERPSAPGPIEATILDRGTFDVDLEVGCWRENVRRSMPFSSAVRSALAAGTSAFFVEISPHPVLNYAIEEEIAAAGGDGAVVPSLHRDLQEPVSLLTSLGKAYVRGCMPDWDRLYEGGRFVPPPGYPWQRKRFWVDPPRWPGVA